MRRYSTQSEHAVHESKAVLPAIEHVGEGDDFPHFDQAVMNIRRFFNKRPKTKTLTHVEQEPPPPSTEPTSAR